MFLRSIAFQIFQRTPQGNTFKHVFTVFPRHDAPFISCLYTVYWTHALNMWEGSSGSFDGKTILIMIQGYFSEKNLKPSIFDNEHSIRRKCG